MKTFFYALMLGLNLTLATNAEPIVTGTKIRDANASMEAHGYREGGLEVLHSDQIRKVLGETKKDEKDIENLKVWQVNQGSLVISYVVSTGTITHLNFELHDECPKSLRKQFDFRVISFDPKAESLVIQTTRK